MSRRTQRVAALIRQIVGELILTKLSDPRIDRVRTSVTRVEIGEDLLTAKVYVSVMGTEGQQNRTISALRHASGHVQELMAKKITLRHTPVLTFAMDTEFKKTLDTLDIIRRVTDEIEQKDQARIQAEESQDSQAQGQPDQQTPLPGNTKQDQRS